jgi:hypothetical protein
MTKRHALFVNSKWCDGNPELSLSNDAHNIFNSFRQCRPDFTQNALHLDESSVVYGQHIDGPLLKYCETHKPDIIVMGLLGGSPMNPSYACLEKLQQMGVFICVIWPDTGPGWGFGTILEIGKRIDLNVSWDNPRSPWHDAQPKPANYLNLWTPEDASLYYFHPYKDIDVSFLGSTDKYIDRGLFLQHLIKNKKDIKLFISGGQREGKLTPEQYAEVVKRSKIGINFSLSQTGVFHQAKGRIFEYTSCGGFLLDSANPSTADFFIPNEEYVPFHNPEDLMNKILYYLSHEQERLAIANKGYQRYVRQWTSQPYWDAIISKLDERQSNKTT